MPRPFTVIDSRAVSTAITVLELTNHSSIVLEITRAWVTNLSSTTSVQLDAVLLFKTATITGTTITPVKLERSGPASLVTAKRTATAEGTDGDIVAGEGHNVVNGWLYVPVPKEQIWVPPSGIIALKFPSAPPNVTYRYGINYVEYG